MCHDSLPSFYPAAGYSRDFKSFIATGGNNNRLFANSIGPDETAHLDHCCSPFSLSTLHINIFPSNSLKIKKKKKKKKKEIQTISV